MSAINFVVRDSAGNVRHSAVGGVEGAANVVYIGAGSDISFNLSQSQIIGYSREGQSLHITLADGQVIIVDGFFSFEGVEANTLYISSDGYLTQVDLGQGAGGTYYASYIPFENTGKFSLDDALYFQEGTGPLLAQVTPPDAGAGMLAQNFGIPLIGWGLAALGGVAAIAGGGDKDPAEPQGPTISIDAGVGENDLVNEVDYNNGIDITGGGTPGGEVTVTVRGVDKTTTIDENGNWSVTYDPGELPTGTYHSDVTATVSANGKEATANAELYVDTELSVTFDSQSVGGDGTVNLSEYNAGAVLTGTVDAGSTVVVTYKGVEYQATVTGESWSLEFPAGVLAEGTYTANVQVRATDPAGNVETTSGSFQVDTVNSITLSTAGVGNSDIADGIINSTEHKDGVTLTGTTQPNAMVEVTLGGVVKTVQASGSGTWSAFWSSSDVPTGTGVLNATAISTDAAGNTAQATGQVRYDTEVNPFDIDSGTVGGDGVLSKVETDGSITFYGNVEPGSRVSVMIGDMGVQANVSGNTWSYTLPPNQLRPGEYDSKVTFIATDQAGNQSQLVQDFYVDNVVEPLSVDQPVAGDNVINIDESMAGLTLTGKGEALSQKIEVVFAGVTKTATLNGETWSVFFTKDELAGFDGVTHDVIVRDWDQYGNYAETSKDANGNDVTVTIDTVAPEATSLATLSYSPTGIEAVTLSDSESLTLSVIDSSHNISAEYDANDGMDVGTKRYFEFNPDLPDGSHLVVTDTDAAGNTNSTFVVTNEALTNDVDLGGLESFDIGRIDLSFADDSVLTLDAATLSNLSDHSDKLYVDADQDDYATVNLDGATQSGTEFVDGTTYHVYSFGGDELVYVDDDITVNII